jgi:acyl carrier protein
MSSIEEDVLVAIQTTVEELRLMAGLPTRPALVDHSLVEDLELDSLMFVDLTLILEEKLRIERLPMEDWALAESRKTGTRFTIRSLVEAVVLTVTHE